ncbi:MAG: rhodanese-like domain-containing protein, partial [Muribaculaceae bacterium]|nr:rhodanese-like domain-containing protein [Muribaculaceae bacterium]
RLDKSKPVAVYCRSGKRSADAANLLSSEGFKVTNLLGGILAWEDDKKPIEK